MAMDMEHDQPTIEVHRRCQEYLRLAVCSLLCTPQSSVQSGTHEDPTVAAFLNFRNPVTCGSNKLTIS